MLSEVRCKQPSTLTPTQLSSAQLSALLHCTALYCTALHCKAPTPTQRDAAKPNSTHSRSIKLVVSSHELTINRSWSLALSARREREREATNEDEDEDENDRWGNQCARLGLGAMGESDRRMGGVRSGSVMAAAEVTDEGDTTGVVCNCVSSR